MNYIEFKTSSDRHKVTCKKLLECLETPSSDADKTKILSNLFYLSGYILECILKYAIYDSISYDIEKDITLLDQDGLRYKKDIKKHNIKDLYLTLKCKVSDICIPIIENNGVHESIAELCCDWCPDYRYVDKTCINADVIKNYLSEIYTAHTLILIRMRG